MATNQIYRINLFFNKFGLMCRALPKAEEEEFFKPWMKYTEEEKQRIVDLAPPIFEHRLGPNVSLEDARKAQKATLNK